TDSKTTPNHQGIAGYAFNSADCYFCHPTGQRGSYVDHDAQNFPIFSGTHNGQWNDCTACHPDPANRLNVDCLTCHQHDQQTMNGVHGSMAGYSYVSATCLSCHPTGERGSFVGHDGQFFPIFSGTHNGQWNDCSSCHTVAGDRTTFDCLACHPSTKTDPVHQGFPGYSHASDACFGCHPTGQAGRFTEHDPLYFKIYSGKHNGKWTDCTTCHTNPSDRSQFNCFTCHEHNKSKMDDTHSGESGYQYDSRACLNCHPRV
ncbi:MAG: hypothetical protein ACE5FH_08165, partial [Candidatus Zixiibacteriota bacterium]